MAASFQSKDSLVLGVQLKVQRLVVAYGDSISAISTNDLIVDVKEPIKEVRSALFTDNSAGTTAPVLAASRTISGTQVTCALGVPFAANDCLILEYVIDETA